LPRSSPSGIFISVIGETPKKRSDSRAAAAQEAGDARRMNWKHPRPARRPDVTLNAVFRALSDPTRREILRLLRSGDLTAGEIADRFPLARSTLSGHFNVLKAANLIVSERKGTTIVYSLNVSVSEEALGALLQLLGAGGKERVAES
jgi:ArsR family transcriptional regulator, arsenate/arsenite/antimonite-responsive transcriptional repressor